MTFLSLSKGDPSARQLLQRAIAARYGMRPVPVASVRLGLRYHGKGLFGLREQHDIIAAYVAFNRWQWLESKRLLGKLPTGRFDVSFDGKSVYQRRGKALDATRNDDQIISARTRLWCGLTFFLTPLTTEGVTLNSLSENSFEAVRDDLPGIKAVVRLDDQDRVSVESDCLRTDLNRMALFSLRGQGEIKTFNGFAVPSQIIFEWANPPSVYEVTNAEVNPVIAESSFSLQ